MDHPTRFYSWWLNDAPCDLTLSEQTKAIDPRGKGISQRTVRRVRCGESADARSVKLLMEVTGLDFECFLPLEFLKALEGQE